MASRRPSNQYASAEPGDVMDVDALPAPVPATSKDKGKGKAVSFSEDTKPPAPAPSEDTKEGAKEAAPQRTVIDGIIGQLEVHRSGAVKMRLKNGIVMDVSNSPNPYRIKR